ncbi:hypothetical protein TcasGA2_TC002725 [Tribolium castaneum]|uniref:Uncharacterized protein n=1 Tax=Tribolium castaneum TaxID=7070 RepID=D6WDR7_TRICA|nr:hypothetical protein TcasGA2_TC002725 [Tribolium castaneum]
MWCLLVPTSKVSDVAVEVKERSDVLARPRDFLDFNTLLTLTRTLPARYISPANRCTTSKRNQHALLETTDR